MSSKNKFFWAWSFAGLLEVPFIFPLCSATSRLLSDHFFLALGLHLSAAGLLWVKCPKRTGLLFFPGIGWILAGILSWTQLAKQKNEEDEEIFGYAAHILPEKMWPRALQKTRVLHELDFMSLAEVLTGDDIDLKRGAIERLAQLRTREAIALLLEQKVNPSYEIRFYATAALARIKKELDEELESAKEEMKQDIYKVSARLLLAKRYLFYARSQLLDPETAASYIQEALYHLKFILQTPYASEESHWLLVEIYLDREQWDEALGVLEQLKKAGIADLERFAKTLTRLYFLTGRYPDLVGHLREIKPFLTGDWAAVGNWWGVT